jgi:hypothetical protein
MSSNLYKAFFGHITNRGRLYRTSRLMLLHTIAQHFCSHSRHFKHSLRCPVYLGTGIVFVGYMCAVFMVKFEKWNVSGYNYPPSVR